MFFTRFFCRWYCHFIAFIIIATIFTTCSIDCIIKECTYIIYICINTFRCTDIRMFCCLCTDTIIDCKISTKEKIQNKMIKNKERKSINKILTNKIESNDLCHVVRFLHIKDVQYIRYCIYYNHLLPHWHKRLNLLIPMNVLNLAVYNKYLLLV